MATLSTIKNVDLYMSAILLSLKQQHNVILGMTIIKRCVYYTPRNGLAKAWLVPPLLHSRGWANYAHWISHTIFDTCLLV